MTVATENKAILEDLHAAEAKITELEACNDELTRGLFAVLQIINRIAKETRDLDILPYTKEAREFSLETLKDAGR